MRCGIFIKKTIFFTNFYVSGSQSLHIWQIHWVFCLIFAGIKTKTSQSSLYSTAFFKILKEPALVQKPTIPHMKALISSYLEIEEWGRGIIMGVPRPPPIKLFATFLSEVVEAKRVDFFKKKIWLGQMSASHKCTNTVFMTLKCIFDGLISICFHTSRDERPCTRVWKVGQKGISPIL